MLCSSSSSSSETVPPQPSIWDQLRYKFLFSVITVQFEIKFFFIDQAYLISWELISETFFCKEVAKLTK